MKLRWWSLETGSTWRRERINAVSSTSMPSMSFAAEQPHRPQPGIPAENHADLLLLRFVDECTRQNFALVEHLTRAAHIDRNEFLRYLPRDRASGLHARRQFEQDPGNERSHVEQYDGARRKAARQLHLPLECLDFAFEGLPDADL